MTALAVPRTAAHPPIRPRRMRLNNDQRDLAERYLPLARALAKPLKAAWPGAWDEFESAACMALVEAAGAYEPERGVKFGTFARHRIRGALRDVQRKMVALGWRSDASHAPNVGGMNDETETHGRILNSEPDAPVGSMLEAEEEIDTLLRRLPSRHAAACRELYLMGKTQVEAARAIGCSQSRLSSVHREAIAMLDGSWYAQARAEFAI